ncbi:protein shisa-5-like [Portunus trituberculatus]|uniref:protein shisa-5-like n=1 Tax=Portunus trituberculatus TaxID=210409 RepID=UPI001E1CB0A2|nr:protein shisa-5-like [Portunus trituberculatus]
MDRLLKVVLLVVSLAATGSSFRCERENLWGSTQYFSCPEPGDNPNDVYCCGFGDNKFCCSSQAQEEILEEFFDKVPSVPLALAQVQAEDTKQRALAKLNDTVRATKDKVKTTIGGKVKDIKDKVKAKINSTVSDTKAKAKQKVKDKVKEKASKKLDPTGGHLPTILGVIAAIIITIIVLCIVCCCCCPFCLLYKRRNHGTVRNPANPEVSVMQPLQGQPQPYPSQPYPAAPQQQAPYPTQPMAMQAAPAPYPPQPYPPTGYPGEQPPMYTEKQPPPYNPTY